MAASHTLYEIRQNFHLIKYTIDTILLSMNSMNRQQDIDQFFESTSEVLNIVSMVKLCVETSVDIAAIDETSSTMRPSPITQRSR